MKISKILKLLTKNIKSIIIENSSIEDISNLKVITYKHKYSSKLEPTLKLSMNGGILKSNDRLEYLCINCNSLSNISVGRFLTKNTIYCKRCIEKSDFKLNSRGSTKEYKLKIPNDISKLDTNLLIVESNKQFELENDEFKLNYFSKYLTKIEFDKIKFDIHSINGVLMDDKTIFLEHIRTNHNMKYTNKILVGNKIISISDIVYKCNCCDKIFTGRNLKNRIDNDILCRRCSLSNETFKIRFIMNINDKKIIYQSSPELELINYCNDNNILIENGPILDYTINGISKKYHLDFKIGKILVEVKDNHIWYKNEVESGIWLEKEKSANDYCKLHGLEFVLCFNIDEFTKNKLKI